jgi:hypothetical protein
MMGAASSAPSPQMAAGGWEASVATLLGVPKGLSPFTEPSVTELHGAMQQATALARSEGDAEAARARAAARRQRLGPGGVAAGTATLRGRGNRAHAPLLACPLRDAVRGAWGADSRPMKPTGGGSAPLRLLLGGGGGGGESVAAFVVVYPYKDDAARDEVRLYLPKDWADASFQIGVQAAAGGNMLAIVNTAKAAPGWGGWPGGYEVLEPGSQAYAAGLQPVTAAPRPQAGPPSPGAGARNWVVRPAKSASSELLITARHHLGIAIKKKWPAGTPPRAPVPVRVDVEGVMRTCSVSVTKAGIKLILPPPPPWGPAECVAEIGAIGGRLALRRVIDGAAQLEWGGADGTAERIAAALAQSLAEA